ncbi:MAG TPA: malto-oligosyltrehalose trehalohydrolase [Solirubrobacteraceae bacterium]|nr:malto-oligosyltrehalose trehalohydrolase [Solirubrobacteraceae bacterium]
MATAPEYPFRRPLGAFPRCDGAVEFRVWAPRPAAVAVRLGRRDHPLAAAGYGVWEGVVPDTAPGDDYFLVLDGRRYPDPCSRFQPRGLRGPSRVVDTGAFAWADSRWPGLSLDALVVYELHVGTFSAEGTFEGVIPGLDELRALGVTAIELMPVTEFPGVRGWGYDGVYAGAPHHAYGGPEGLQRLVNAAHAKGVGVILDVVYNHVGASGVRALKAFGPYFADRYDTDWGKAINYDDAGCDGVREWAIQNACRWVRDYHVDGLRLDAVHAILDAGPRHVLEELADRVRAARPGALVIAESNRNDPRLLRPPAVGGLGLDAQWADDFHHALRALLTDEREGYYRDFGRVADLAKAFGRPFVYDGRWSEVRERRVGAPAGDRPPEQFVVFSQNHDQVGNRAFGDRMPREARPLAAFCVLLSPFTPLLFMGEEYGEEAPFQFFTDHIERRIARATREGRRNEFAHFAAFAGEEVPDPQAVAVFLRSKLTRRVDADLAALYRTLLRARRELPREATDVDFDEDARWLRVRRGAFELACNFAGRRGRVPVSGGAVVLATHEETAVADGHVQLPPLGGVVVR